MRKWGAQLRGASKQGSSRSETGKVDESRAGWSSFTMAPHTPMSALQGWVLWARKQLHNAWICLVDSR